MERSHITLLPQLTDLTAFRRRVSCSIRSTPGRQRTRRMRAPIACERFFRDRGRGTKGQNGWLPVGCLGVVRTWAPSAELQDRPRCGNKRAKSGELGVGCWVLGVGFSVRFGPNTENPTPNTDPERGRTNG